MSLAAVVVVEVRIPPALWAKLVLAKEWIRLEGPNVLEH